MAQSLNYPPSRLSMLKFHLRIEPYCILCQHPLPNEEWSRSARVSYQTRPKIEWGSDVLCCKS
jgi:hypothetical protein